MTSDYPAILQTYPIQRQALLEGLYLGENLAETAAKTGRSLVFANFLTDRNGVIAAARPDGLFRVPPEIRNRADWRLFQELMAQADVIITGAAYLKRAALLGKEAQNVLFQFEASAEYAMLGEWRLQHGYPRRSPDLAVVTRSLNTEAPAGILESGRRVTVFTTHAAAASRRADELRAAGVSMVGGGENGVDGNILIDTLGGMGYRVIHMATGPRVLGLLLEAGRLDRLYVTEAQVELPVPRSEGVLTVLPPSQSVHALPGFRLAHRYREDGVTTASGTTISQDFLRFDLTD